MCLKECNSYRCDCGSRLHFLGVFANSLKVNLSNYITDLHVNTARSSHGNFSRPF